MGLFDRLVRDTVGKAVGDVVGGALSDAFEKATGIDVNGDGARGTNPYGEKQAAPQYAPPTATNAPASYGEPAKDHAYFAALIAEKFAEYQVAEYVPVSQFGGEGKPYDFVLSQGGKAVATIMLTEHNRDNNRAYKGAKAASEAAGVPFVNFYLHMPNERGFIINRIGRFLGRA